MKIKIIKSKSPLIKSNYDRTIINAIKLLEKKDLFAEEIKRIRNRLNIPIKGLCEKELDKLFDHWNHTGEKKLIDKTGKYMVQ